MTTEIPKLTCKACGGEAFRIELDMTYYGAMCITCGDGWYPEVELDKWACDNAERMTYRSRVRSRPDMGAAREGLLAAVKVIEDAFKVREG